MEEPVHRDGTSPKADSGGADDCIEGPANRPARLEAAEAEDAEEAEKEELISQVRLISDRALGRKVQRPTSPQLSASSSVTST